MSADLGSLKANVRAAADALEIAVAIIGPDGPVDSRSECERLARSIAELELSFEAKRCRLPRLPSAPQPSQPGEPSPCGEAASEEDEDADQPSSASFSEEDYAAFARTKHQRNLLVDVRTNLGLGDDAANGVDNDDLIVENVVGGRRSRRCPITNLPFKTPVVQGSVEGGPGNDRSSRNLRSSNIRRHGHSPSLPNTMQPLHAIAYTANTQNTISHSSINTSGTN
eukprot:GHVT01094937.1.p1 GENE.GHVT01094937.1~~GHVT01094937.1.p1  ORF type:complete len:225 (-),score=49.45 GHVT01094937.1:104-778(-)